MQMEVSQEMLISSDRHPGYSRISQKGIRFVSVTKCQEGQGISRAASLKLQGSILPFSAGWLLLLREPSSSHPLRLLPAPSEITPYSLTFREVFVPSSEL